MKRRSSFYLVLVALLAAVLVGCGGSSAPEPSGSGSSGTVTRQSSVSATSLEGADTIEFDGVTIALPQGWTTRDAENGIYLVPSYDGMVFLARIDFDYDADIKDAIYAFIEGFESDGSLRAGRDFDQLVVGEATGYRTTLDSELDNGTYIGWLELIVGDHEAYSVAGVCSEDEFDAHAGEVLAVMNSISAGGSAPASSGSGNSASGNNTSGGNSSSGNASGSQSEALESAQSYLSFMAFSREGLIGQLEYEGFSHEDAEYAVDNCGADWDEQAVLSAKDYLDFSAFSYDGLIEQLEYEGFTHDQAVHGVDACGADWDEQAVLMAQEYLEYGEFSHDELVDQLEFEGFSHDQAEAAVTAAGL